MVSGMVVAPQPEAVEAGVEILMQGGNAVDAVIAGGLVQGAVDHQMCGIAGFGSLLVHRPQDGSVESIDFHGRCPAAVRPDMWEHLLRGETRDGFGFVLEGGVNNIGYQSVTTPGALAAYHLAVERHGTRALADLLQPAIDYAENGFKVRPRTHSYWTTGEDQGRVKCVDQLAFSATGRKMYFTADGEVVPQGTVIRNPDLAATLRTVAEEGIDVFYEGRIARRIDEDMRAHGGLVTADDLGAYRPDILKPLEGSYRGFRFVTNNPPGGGVMLIEMLNILEEFDLKAMGHNSPDYIRVVSEAMKRATIDKDNRVADPKFVDVPLALLTSKDYGRKLARAIRAGEVASVERFEKKPQDTTQIVAVDRDGLCATMTHSLGSPSGVITDGLGFMYNGCMSVFDPRPGRTGSLAAGKARFSGIAPTIMYRDGRPWLVIGAHGGTQIPMSLLQTILNIVDFNMTMQEAVSAPRFSATSNIIDVLNRIPRYVTREVEKMGYRVERSHLSYGFGTPHGIMIEDGVLKGGTDPSRDGMALAVPEVAPARGAS